MILSGKTIKQKVESGEIVIEPEPDDCQYQPASLDFKLGDQLYNVAKGSYTPNDNKEVVLQPNIPYLGHSLEWLELPDDIAAFATGRSSVGREGVIIHKTAGWVDPGFTGNLTLEMYNFNFVLRQSKYGHEIVVEDQSSRSYEPGARIGQLVFFPLDQPSDGYDGQYQGQKKPNQGSV